MTSDDAWGAKSCTHRPRERKRAQRARESAARSHQLGARPPVVAVVDHADPVGALAAWAASTLIVPPGHPRSGQPMALPDFAADWLRASWDAHESALSTARKNAKSAIAAVLALGYLVGPLRRPGWRGAIASLDKGKAAELRRQVAEIAEASHLDVRIRRSPYPGVIESSTGSLDTLSADRHAAQSSGYDLVIVDETGLFPLRARDLLAGLRSSVSARAGKVRHISIRGDSELFREILENPAVVSHVYAAADDCEVGDEGGWRAANPGLGTIKALSYMREEVARVAGVASDEPSFRALDLNQEISPMREMLCSPDDLRACFVDEIDCRGPAYVGLDIGEAGSGTAACAYWPATGALRTWLAFGDTPTLTDRAKRDGSDYGAMERRGELRTYPGRVVPIRAFVADVRADLAGAHGAPGGRRQLPGCGAAGLLTVGADGHAERDGAGRLGGSARVSTRRADGLVVAAEQSELGERDQRIDPQTRRNGNPALDASPLAWPD